MWLRVVCTIKYMVTYTVTCMVTCMVTCGYVFQNGDEYLNT